MAATINDASVAGRWFQFILCLVFLPVGCLLYPTLYKDEAAFIRIGWLYLVAMGALHWALVVWNLFQSYGKILPWNRIILSPLLESLRSSLALLTVTAMVPFLLCDNIRTHNTTMIFLDVLLSLSILFVWIIIAQEAVRWLRTRRTALGPQGPG